MHRLHNMKDTLVSCVQGQMTHLDYVDTKELGEVIDMIKDLSEAIYYCTITEAMEGKDSEKDKEYKYYIEPSYYRDMDRPIGKMYYTETGVGMGMEHDVREGRSHMTRKTYMEAKELHHDKAIQMKELEKYMQELSTDIAEMIDDATPEEKQILHQRLTTLAAKIK